MSYALEEARIRGAELLLFRAIGDSSPNERSGTAAVEEAKGSGRDVRVREEERRGDPVDLLVERSAEADLIVVGTRSLGLTAGLLRGSVGQRLTVRARCPVVVIPG
ncbi:universal stress protein [Nocardiopsis eucommiae]|uniref:Universal stress protein n=1 Tax=Nocardiopsis eucommiae TaxID=2831970 RepID=A0A975QLM1_9ACTN|nr:universal stress protein [Nocardiopsis eucommiae]